MDLFLLFLIGVFDAVHMVMVLAYKSDKSSTLPRRKSVILSLTDGMRGQQGKKVRMQNLLSPA